MSTMKPAAIIAAIVRMCSAGGCDRRHYGHGYCQLHLERMQKYGQLEVPPRRWDPDRRFWTQVNKTNSCWEWTGVVTPRGYGTIYKDGKVQRAHRVSYELANGSIPEGAQLDHICRNRKCVRPDHLRPVNHKQNMENSGGLKTNSLPRGVSAAGRKFRARVVHYKKEYCVGTFETVEEAAAAAVAKRNELYTHNNVDWSVGGSR